MKMSVNGRKRALDRKRLRISVLFLLSAVGMMGLATVGCSKAESDGSGDEGTAAGGGKSGGTKKAKVAELKGLGIKATVPAGASVRKAPVGDGVMVQGPGLVVTVEKAKASRPKTIAAAKKDADMYTPKNIKSEKLADGWVFTFENKGGMGKNYFVQVRRKIGNTDFWCSTTAHKPAQQKNALAFCKSLKK